MKPYFETKLGKLFCGDCLEVMKDIPDGSIDLVLTDPPYLIKYKTNYRKNKNHEFCSPIQNDDNSRLIQKFVRISYQLLKENRAFYCFGSWKTVDYFKREIESYFNLKNIIIWVKNNWTAGDLKAQYSQQYEVIFYANKGRLSIKGKRLSDIWYSNRIAGKGQRHQNEKPLKLIEQIIDKSSDKDDLILDPFLGSGTTAAACEKLGRKWIGVEISEPYCEIAKKRLAQQRLFS